MIIDLEKVEFDKKMELEVPGWENLCVEYVYRAYSGISWLLWKVSGTDHVFQIQHQTILTHHGVDIKEHFSLTLETFRKDYLDWKAEEFPEEWMKKYQKMFEKMIKA
jgi:hypothetical protein